MYSVLCNNVENHLPFLRYYISTLPKLTLAFEASLVYCWLLLSYGQLTSQAPIFFWTEGKRQSIDCTSNMRCSLWQVQMQGCLCLNEGEGECGRALGP